MHELLFWLGSFWQEMSGAVCTLMLHWGYFSACYSFLRAGSWGRLPLFQALEYLQGCYFCLIHLSYRTSVSARWSAWGAARVSTKGNSTSRPWVCLAAFGCNIFDEVLGITRELELNTTLRRRKRGGRKRRKRKTTAAAPINSNNNNNLKPSKNRLCTLLPANAELIFRVWPAQNICDLLYFRSSKRKPWLWLPPLAELVSRKLGLPGK